MIMNINNNLTRRMVGSLWVNWAVAFGAIALELLLPRLMPKSWLPIPVFALAYAELVYMRTQQQRESLSCTAMLRVSTLTLFWSAIVMLIINILNSKLLFDNIIDWSNTNKDIPFITCLIIFPTMIVMALWVMANGYMQVRQTPLGGGSELRQGNGVVSSLFSRESRYQVQLMLCIAIGFTGVEWWYYFKYYFNVNMNTPDVFFFNWMPIAFYCLSLFFVWSRYQNIAAIIGPIAEHARGQGVMVRYLILSGDRMLLAINEHDRWDTPAVTHLGSLAATGDEAVRETFARISGCENFGMRFLYETGIDNLTPDVKHYAVFLDSENYPSKSALDSWFTLDQIDRFIKTARLSADLTDEIYRIFTITMAWKTYDRQGRRLYPIKHYRPTFRLRDLKDWAVDYGDMSWMSIAEVNQDRPFFRARRLWRKITGSKV